ncbi:MAG: N-acetyltransferase [Synergistaceae bacterium]|nr:N-acetyltransferase [Synergistaceae bacterium]
MSEKHAQVSIVFEENANRSAAYDGHNQIGECEFTVSSGTWTITHTGVRPEYGGQGIARRLVEKVIEEARSRSVKIIPVCSYAVKLMEGSEEYSDVL